MKFFKMILMAGICAGLSVCLTAQTAETTPVAESAPLPDASAAPTSAPEPGPSPLFGMSFDLGYNPIYSPANKAMENWQRIGLRPDLAIGDFGIALNLDINFRFDGGPNGNDFEVRPEDWIVTDKRNFFEIYLPKIRYIRLFHKGDPLYLSFGNVETGTLGNGFIVNGYNNTLFQPDQRVFGMSFDLDGKLFKFPYVGIETMIGNFAAWDVLAMRLFVRPAAGSGVSILEGMQIGFSLAADTDPYYFSPDAAVKANPAKIAVGIWGVDIITPLVKSDPFNLSFLGDLAMENVNFGAQIGLGGNAFGFLTYSGMIRFLGANYIPDYFDNLYDLVREKRLAVYTAPATTASPYAGWLVSLGVNIQDSAFYFITTLNGPFNADPSVVYKYPDLKAAIGLKQGIIGGLSLQASYSKSNISTFESLVDPTDALIGAQVAYAMGPAVIRLVYQVSYDPYGIQKGLANNWQINSRLETSIVLIGTGVTP